MSEWIVTPQELTLEGFAPFGEAILIPKTASSSFGKAWECWFPLGDLGDQIGSVGMVITSPTDGLIESMEREPTKEFLVPLRDPIVQAVAPPGDVEDPNEQPDPESVRAFIIRPGQAIIMSPGTWHWAAMPLSNEPATYLFVGEDHPPLPGRESSPWVPYLNNYKARVVLPQ
jgi:ureidoglycolate lyase